MDPAFGVIFVQWKAVEMSIFVVIVPSDESPETDGFDEAVESAKSLGKQGVHGKMIMYSYDIE